MVYTKYTETKPVEYHFTKTITFDFMNSGRVSRLSRKTKVVSIEIMGWRILVVRLGMDFLRNQWVRIGIRLS